MKKSFSAEDGFGTKTFVARNSKRNSILWPASCYALSVADEQEEDNYSSRDISAEPINEIRMRKMEEKGINAEKDNIGRNGEEFGFGNSERLEEGELRGLGELHENRSTYEDDDTLEADQLLGRLKFIEIVCFEFRKNRFMKLVAFFIVSQDPKSEKVFLFQ